MYYNPNGVEEHSETLRYGRRVAADFRPSEARRTREIGRYQDSSINYQPDRQFSNAGIYVCRPTEVTVCLASRWSASCVVQRR